MYLSKRASIPTWKAWLIRIAAVILALVICGGVAFLLIEKLQKNPEKITDFYYAFIKGAFSSPRRIWKFLKELSILLCISLALTPAFRMRFWNIGGEGQTLIPGVLGQDRYRALAVRIDAEGLVPSPGKGAVVENHVGAIGYACTVLARVTIDAHTEAHIAYDAVGGT